MVIIKSIFFLTSASQHQLLWHTHQGMGWLIEKTYFYPLDILWESITVLSSLGNDPIAFYKLIIPPMIIFAISALFIGDHRALKIKYRKLKAEVQDEIDKRDMRKDAGLENIPENASLDVIIKNTTNSDPAWHNKWWGKIFMAVAIALVLITLGLK